MGFRVPTALAGEDNEVEMDGDGARKVLELIAGTGLAAGIVTAGVFLFNRASNVAGSDQQVQDLY